MRINNSNNIMKKLILLSLVVICALTLGLSSVSAQTTGANSSVRFNANVDTRVAPEIRIDAKAKAEIDSLIKTENARCDNITDPVQKKNCLVQVDLRVKERASLFDDKEKMMRSDETMKRQVEDRPARDEDRNDPERFGKTLEIVVKRLTATYDRFTTLGDRIEARIEKMDSNENTDEAKKYLESARNHLTQARSIILQIQSTDQIFGLQNTVKPDENEASPIAKTREIVKSAMQRLALAHKNLKEAVSSLKEVDTNINGEVRSSIEFKNN